MSVNLIFKIAAVGILVSVICQVLKHSGREEQAFLTSLAGLVLVLFWICLLYTSISGNTLALKRRSQPIRPPENGRSIICRAG